MVPVIIADIFITQYFFGPKPATIIGVVISLHILLIYFLAKRFCSGAATNTASEELKAAQQQLMKQEKLASIGMLTAGIAHEIKNPLNFVNNFSDMTVDLVDELKDELKKTELDATQKETIGGIVEDIGTNCKKINEHGKRAESIIKNMLIQTRSSEVDKVPVDLNQLLDEYLNLAYHGLRAQNNKFNAKMETRFIQ